MRYLWLGLAIVAAVVGVVIGRVLNLSPPVTVTLAAVPAFLVLFPFMKPWMPKAKFAFWLIAAVISTAVAWLLYLGFSRFGG